jgi:hypothetical protein
MPNEPVRNITKCKGCGAPIFFEQNVPWYARAVPVLEVGPNGEWIKGTAYVSHFINCPKADSFSKTKKA